MDHAKRGADALAAGHYPDAVTAYTEAIRTSPKSPDYFIKRSTAHQRSSPPDYTSALADAEQAVVLAQARAKRELIVQAQLRRGIALFGLERYADAQFVLDVVKRMDPKEKTLGIWESKIKTKLEGVGSDNQSSKVTVTETPSITEKTPNTQDTQDVKSSATKTSGPDSTVKAAAQTPASKIRHDWYQNNENVIFTLLAKGVPKDKVKIDIQPRSLSVSFPLVSDSDYDFSLDPLYAPVDVALSKFSVMSTKVEVTLRKAQPGQKWHALESSEPVSTDADTAKTSIIPSHILQSTNTNSQAAAYPTSSRNGPKNWDKLANELTAKKSDKDGDKSGKSKDDDDWDYEKEDGDEVNGFFKKLYSGATPDVRRAMMKSFTESNGTALSTNWSEVSKGKVETQPPDGMEAKNWGK